MDRVPGVTTIMEAKEAVVRERRASRSKERAPRVCLSVLRRSIHLPVTLDFSCKRGFGSRLRDALAEEQACVCSRFLSFSSNPSEPTSQPLALIEKYPRREKIFARKRREKGYIRGGGKRSDSFYFCEKKIFRDRIRYLSNACMRNNVLFLENLNEFSDTRGFLYFSCPISLRMEGIQQAW